MTVCPHCQSQAIKRTHRQGFSEQLASLVFVYPYRCRKCEHRFSRFRFSSKSENHGKKREWAKRRREILVYVVGILIFLAMLSFIIRERAPISDGN